MMFPFMCVRVCNICMFMYVLHMRAVWVCVREHLHVQSEAEIRDTLLLIKSVRIKYYCL